MINWIFNLFDNRTLGGKRSSGWSATQKAFIAINNVCAATGKKGTLLDPLQVHHVKPFHLNPELELDPNNLITLRRSIHLWLAHLGSWSSYNLNIREDAAILRQKIANRP